MIVMKIGGSSVDTAEAIGRVSEDRPQPPGAPPGGSDLGDGEDDPESPGGRCRGCSGRGGQGSFRLRQIELYHRREAYAEVPPGGRPALDAMLDPWFNEQQTRLDEIMAVRSLSPKAADTIAGYGELQASAILSFALSHGRHRFLLGGLPAGAGDGRRFYPARGRSMDPRTPACARPFCRCCARARCLSWAVMSAPISRA